MARIVWEPGDFFSFTKGAETGFGVVTSVRDDQCLIFIGEPVKRTAPSPRTLPAQNLTYLFVDSYQPIPKASVVEHTLPDELKLAVKAIRFFIVRT